MRGLSAGSLCVLIHVEILRIVGAIALARFMVSRQDTGEHAGEQLTHRYLCRESKSLTQILGQIGVRSATALRGQA